MLRMLLITTVFFLSACANTTKNDPSPEYKAKGGDSFVYKITAIPTTKLDNAGDECGQVKGDISVINSKVSGEVTDAYKRTFNVTGVVDELGQVSGSLAVIQGNVAKFQGKIGPSGGEGKWQDVFKCSGNWSAKKI